MFQTENLYQNDENWKSVPLGNQNTETIGSWGCLLTSITMMLNGAGYQETPLTVNAKLKQSGGFDGALLIPSVLPYLYPKIHYRNYEKCENRPAPTVQIDAALAQGKPVIVCVDWNQQGGVQTHWVLLKERQGNDYLIYDPYQYSGDGPDKPVLLTQRYRHQGTRPEDAIHAVMWFEMVAQPTPPPDKPKVPVPADAVEIYSQIDDLAFRADPNLNGHLLRRLIAGSQLISLEARGQSEAKIGQIGEWLHVQDTGGDQGYVAAWYVIVKTSPPPVVPVPPGALIVLPTEGDLAFRSQPLVAPETLLARLAETEQLVVLEPAAQAAGKIGVVGQWLNVKVLRSGQNGYVAAWYVSRAPGGSPPPVTPPVTPPPATPPPGSLIVLPTQADLAFRSQPLVSDQTLIRRLSAEEALTVIEPAATAAQKIGVVGQWLNVKTSDAQPGYVAAWYVQLPGGVPPTPAPPPPSGPLKVHTTTEGVALRTQPVVNESTLITRLPDAAELTVLDENPDSKIGVMNEWLKVRDAQGNEGYIAGWYVAR